MKLCTSNCLDNYTQVWLHIFQNFVSLIKSPLRDDRFSLKRNTYKTFFFLKITLWEPKFNLLCIEHIPTMLKLWWLCSPPRPTFSSLFMILPSWTLITERFLPPICAREPSDRKVFLFQHNFVKIIEMMTCSSRTIKNGIWSAFVRAQENYK